MQGSTRVEGETEANYAVRMGDFATIQRLHAQGVNFNEANPGGDYQGDTPILTALTHKNPNRDKIIMYLVEECGIDLARKYHVADFQGGGLLRQRIYKSYGEDIGEFTVAELNPDKGCIPLILYIERITHKEVPRLLELYGITATIDMKTYDFLINVCRIEVEKSKTDDTIDIKRSLSNYTILLARANEFRQRHEEAIAISMRYVVGNPNVKIIKSRNHNGEVFAFQVPDHEEAQFIQSYFLSHNITRVCEVVSILGKPVVKLHCDDLLREAYRNGTLTKKMNLTIAMARVNNLIKAFSHLGKLNKRFNPETFSLELYHNGNRKVSARLQRLYDYICTLCDLSDVVDITLSGFSIPNLSKVDSFAMTIFTAECCKIRFEHVAEIIINYPEFNTADICERIDVILCNIILGTLDSVADPKIFAISYVMEFGVIDRVENPFFLDIIEIGIKSFASTSVIDYYIDLMCGNKPIKLDDYQFSRLCLLMVSQSFPLNIIRDIFAKFALQNITTRNNEHSLFSMAILGDLNSLKAKNAFTPTTVIGLIVGAILRNAIDQNWLEALDNELNACNFKWDEVNNLSAYIQHDFEEITLPYLTILSNSPLLLDYILAKLPVNSCNKPLTHPCWSRFSFPMPLTMTLIAYLEGKWELFKLLIGKYQAERLPILVNLIANVIPIAQFQFYLKQLVENYHFDLLLVYDNEDLYQDSALIKSFCDRYATNRPEDTNGHKFTLKEVADIYKNSVVQSYITSYSDKISTLLQGFPRFVMKSFHLDKSTLPHYCKMDISKKLYHWLSEQIKITISITLENQLGYHVIIPLTSSNMAKIQTHQSIITSTIESLVKQQQEIIQRSPQLKQIQENLLLLFRTVTGFSNWQHQNGVHSSIANINQDILIRMENAQLLLQLILRQCELDDKLIELSPASPENNLIWSLKISHTSLRNPALLRLVNDKNYVKYTRRAFAYINAVQLKITNIESVESIIAKNDTELLAARHKVDADPEKNPAKIASPTQSHRDHPEKAEKKPTKKSKNTKLAKKMIKSEIDKKEATSHFSAAKQQRQGPKIAPQPLPEKPLPKAMPSVVLNSSSPTEHNFVKTSDPQKLDPSVQTIPQEMLSCRAGGQQDILLVSEFVKKIECIISAMQQGQNSPSTGVAGWHYLFAQIGNLLSSFSNSHPIITELFNSLLYSARSLRDSHKHWYIPSLPLQIDDVMSLPCFQDLAALKAALTYMGDGKVNPSQECKKNVSRLSEDWARFAMTASQNNNLISISANLTAKQFGHFLRAKIKEYSDEINTLVFKTNQNVVVDYAIRFYLSRLGELVGHFPYSKRTELFKYARHFRNAAAHSFENDYGEPNIDLENLKKLLAQESPCGFFDDSADQDWQFFVNKHFDYQMQSENISLVQLLTELKVKELVGREQIATTIKVCKPARLSKQTNLYALIKPYLDTLKNCPEALILLPASLKSERSDSIPLATALHFKCVNGILELVSIVYSSVVDDKTGVNVGMASLCGNWAAETNQKVSCNEIAIRSISPYQDDDHGVLQVELLACLADHHLTNNLTQFSKAKDEVWMMQLRQAHLQLLWPQHKEVYFQQMLANGINQRSELFHDQPYSAHSISLS